MNSIVQQPIDLVFSLSTSPKRLSSINQTLESLLNQSYPAKKIYINCPYLFLRNSSIFDENLLKEIKAIAPEIIEIIRSPDYGPITKLLPTLQHIGDPSTVIVTVDDDNIYVKDLLYNFAKDLQVNYDAIWVAGMWPFENNRCFAVTEGWSGVAIRRGLIDVDDLMRYVSITNENEFCFRSDDLVLSFYYFIKNIPTFRSIHQKGRTSDIILHINEDAVALYKSDEFNNTERYMLALKYLKERFVIKY